METKINRLKELLQTFIEEKDRSSKMAAEIEGAIVDAGLEERFDDLVHALASYQPGGGEFLQDAEALVLKCRTALRELEATFVQQKSTIYSFAGGDITFWVEQEAIHIKAVDGSDPVELTQDEALRLANALKQACATLK